MKKRPRDKPRGGTYVDALATYRSRLPSSSLEAPPSYPLALDIRSSPAFTVEHQYEPRERRKRIIARASLFCFRVFEIHSACVYRLCFYTCTFTAHRNERKDGIRRKASPRTTNAPPVKSIFLPPPPRRFIRRSRRQKTFRSGTSGRLCVTESSYIPYSVAITMLYDFACDRQPPFSLCLTLL